MFVTKISVKHSSAKGGDAKSFFQTKNLSIYKVINPERKHFSSQLQKLCKICHGFSMLCLEKSLFNEFRNTVKIHVFKCISQSSQISGLALIHKVLLFLLL